MSKLVLTEKDSIPTEKTLKKTLGDTFKFYLSIRNTIQKQLSPIIFEWKYYGKKNGWLLKHLYKKRNLFFLLVFDGYFKLSFTFGDSAVEKINKSDLNKNIIEQLKTAKKYSEGRTIQIIVDSESQVELVITLLRFKI